MGVVILKGLKVKGLTLKGNRIEVEKSYCHFVYFFIIEHTCISNY